MFEPLTEWVCLLHPHFSSTRRKEPGALGVFWRRAVHQPGTVIGERYIAFMDVFVIAAYSTWTSDFNTIF